MIEILSYFNTHNVQILPAHKKCSSIGIYLDSGDLVYNNYLKDIPRGIPVYLLFVEKHPPKDKIISNYFFLFPEYDDVYYTRARSGFNKKAIVGKKCRTTELGFIPDNYTFDHPIENVRSIAASTDSHDFYRMKPPPFNENELIFFIDEYNKNPQDFFDKT